MQPLFYCDKCGEFTNQDPRVPVKEAQLDREETIRRVAMVASDLATVISELANAKLAGK
jgi:hypothetical protein